MLVIKRKEGQSLIITDATTGAEIAIAVGKIFGLDSNKVTLVIDVSDPRFRVRRGELLEHP